MHKSDKKDMQDRGDNELRKQKRVFITKHDSLHERARKLGFATDLPGINRAERRRSLKTAIHTEAKPTVVAKRKFIGAKKEA